MTTATEHHDAQLAAIKARHNHVRAKFSDPAVTSIPTADCNGMTFGQMGLEPVVVDALGRFWKMGRDGAVMVFDPFSLSRTPPDRHEGLVAALGDPDDTQAAQGFKAREEPATPAQLKRAIDTAAKGRSWSCTEVKFFDHLRRAEAGIALGEKTTIVAYSNRKTICPSDTSAIAAKICEHADHWANRAA